MNQLSSKQARVVIFVIFALSLASIFGLHFLARNKIEFALSFYGILMVTYLLMKMGLSSVYKPVTLEPPNLTVAVVIPSYNENPQAAYDTVVSILKQDYPINEIFFIDDGSQNNLSIEKVRTLCTEHPNLIVHQMEENLGKRHAQSWAFKRFESDVVVTVDSDSYLLPNAVRELLRPLTDPQVMSVTGHINARNKNKNLLTRLLDMRYDNAFSVERGAQSVTGNILCCSGPITCYRRDVIVENVDSYISQRFLGQPVQFGDDRCLTNYAIHRGKTLYQSTAKCITDVPETLKKFIKQQVRWSKSYFRESYFALKNFLIKKPVVAFWVIFELTLLATYTYVILFSVFARIFTIGLSALLYYLGYIFLAAYARNCHYITKNVWIFILAPIYGIIHLFMLPVRLYALFTLRVNKWGTREINKKEMERAK